MSAAATVVGVTHASGLHSVERSLNALHAEMLRSAADDAGQVRLSVLNVVAACVSDSDADMAVDVLTTIGARHPARVIVIRADPDAEASAIEADVSLQRTTIGDHEVYTELMRLRVGGEPAFHLASVVTPLLIPDIPTDLWVVGAPRLTQAFSDDAVALCDRIILDSGAYSNPAVPLSRIASELARRPHLMIGDFAWERTRIWRELTVQAFDFPGAADWIGAVTSMGIEVTGDHVPAMAWLLAGWVASRLAWPLGREPIKVRVEPGAGGGATLRRMTLTLARGGEGRALAIEATDGLVRVDTSVSGSAVCWAVSYRDPDVTRLMSQLMDESREDRVYPHAVARAATLIV